MVESDQVSGQKLRMPNVSQPSSHPPTQSLLTGMFHRDVRIAKQDVAWLRAVLEAHEGLGFVYGEGGGIVHIVTTPDQADALTTWLNAVSTEAAIIVLPLAQPAT